jgi:hypothetical protein
MDKVRSNQGELLVGQLHQLHLQDPHQNIEELLLHLEQLLLGLLLLLVVLELVDM